MLPAWNGTQSETVVPRRGPPRVGVRPDHRVHTGAPPFDLVRPNGAAPGPLEPADLEALAALVALLETLEHWLAVTTGPGHRRRIAEDYRRRAPQDDFLIDVLAGGDAGP